jgi:hypothetical protein
MVRGSNKSSIQADTEAGEKTWIDELVENLPVLLTVTTHA